MDMLTFVSTDADYNMCDYNIECYVLLPAKMF